jgi:hypothetical protein
MQVIEANTSLPGLIKPVCLSTSSSSSRIINSNSLSGPLVNFTRHVVIILPWLQAQFHVAWLIASTSLTKYYAKLVERCGLQNAACAGVKRKQELPSISKRHRRIYPSSGHVPFPVGRWDGKKESEKRHRPAQAPINKSTLNKEHGSLQFWSSKTRNILFCYYQVFRFYGTTSTKYMVIYFVIATTMYVASYLATYLLP